MARSDTIASRSIIQSAGGQNKDAVGNPLNNRVRVSGKCIVTSYTTAGEILVPADIGLTTIDFIDLTPIFINNSTVPTATNPLYAVYDVTHGKVILGLQ